MSKKYKRVRLAYGNGNVKIISQATSVYKFGNAVFVFKGLLASIHFNVKACLISPVPNN